MNIAVVKEEAHEGVCMVNDFFGFIPRLEIDY